MSSEHNDDSPLSEWNDDTIQEEMFELRQKFAEQFENENQEDENVIRYNKLVAEINRREESSATGDIVYA